MKVISITICLLLASQVFCQTSPFGTGQINNQILGDLQNSSVVFASNSGYGNFSYLESPSSILPTNTFDIYVPTTYDGSEPYGLITYIDSDNDGGFQSSWIPILEQRKLIWVAGDNIGNPVNIDRRISVAWAAVYRMKELFNIDTNRIYTSGQSGGARMAQTLAYIYPEWITGSLPLCGASYPTPVAQDYETYSPDSYYELILNFNQADVDYIKSFDRRYAVMTSFDDYREGDIMNIYYGGFEKDGIDGKFLENMGGHCSTNGIHFTDALNFVEHPDVLIQKDDFSNTTPATGLNYQQKNAQVENGMMNLFYSSDSTESYSYIKTRNGIDWNNSLGSILETTVNWNQFSTNETFFSMRLSEFLSDTLYCQNNGFNNEGLTDKLNVILRKEGNSCEASILSFNAGVIDTLFTGQFLDWNGLNELKIKWHLWNNEWRIEFSEHFSSSQVLNSSVKLLDDLRAVRVRWSEMNGGSGYWNSTSWSTGAYLTLASENTNPISTDKIVLNDLKIISGNENFTFYTNSIVNLTQQGDSLIADNGFDQYKWYLDNDLYAVTTENIISNCVEGNYFVVGLDNEGCNAQSNNLVIDYTSIHQEKDIEFSLFPNPSDNWVKLITNDWIESVSLYDELGREVFFVKPTTKDKEIVLSLSHLSKSIYTIKINTEPHTITSKILIK